MELVDVYRENSIGEVFLASADPDETTTEKTIDQLYHQSAPFYTEPEEDLIKSLPTPCPVMCIEHFVPKSDSAGHSSGAPMVVCGLLNGDILIFSRDSCELINTIKGHTDAVSCIKVFQPLGEALITVISGSKDHTVRVSVALSGDSVGEFSEHTDAVWCLDIFEQYVVSKSPVSLSFSLYISVYVALPKP
jgi:WD40 repeat protein